MDREEYLHYEPLLARRCWAAALDYLLFYGIFYAYVHYFGTENAQGVYEAMGFRHIFAIMGLWFLYFPVVEGILGYTLFKGLFDLRVVPERKNDFAFVVSLKRHFLDPIDFAFFGIVAIILVKVTDQHKRLGDMVAHSRIVLDREEEPAPEDGTPAQAQLTNNQDTR